MRFSYVLNSSERLAINRGLNLLFQRLLRDRSEYPAGSEGRKAIETQIETAAELHEKILKEGVLV